MIKYYLKLKKNFLLFKEILPIVFFAGGLLLIWGLQLFFWLPMITRILLAVVGLFFVVAAFRSRYDRKVDINQPKK